MTDSDTKRKLTPFMRYVTLRLFGRPLFGYFWFIWLACVFFVISLHGASATEPEYGERRLIAIVAGFGILIGLSRVVFLLLSKSGREWLLEVYFDDAVDKVNLGSIVLVRSIPFIALATLYQFLR